MLHQLTADVYYGDWQAPFESIGVVATIVNVAHALRRRGASVYFQRLVEVPWETRYIRMALRDKDSVTDGYIDQLKYIALHMPRPILCHCQLGGHRGPTAAMIVAWFIRCQQLDDYAGELDRLRAVIARNKGVESWNKFGEYHRSALALMRTIEEAAA